jgi:hypothetical protein
VTVFPAKTPASEILAQDFDGVLLSNGPGDHEPVTYAQDNISQQTARFRSLASVSAINSSAWRWAGAHTSSSSETAAAIIRSRISAADASRSPRRITAFRSIPILACVSQYAQRLQRFDQLP